VNWSAVTIAEVPLFVVTRMSVVPAEPAGATAVIWLFESMLKLVAEIVPNLTAVAPKKSVPVTTMVCPPPVAPVAGPTAVTVGAEAVMFV
jgi:hypothetical protein